MTHIFGNEDSFAIRFRLDSERTSENYVFANCNLIFSNKLIGEQNEACLLNTWIWLLLALRNSIEENKSNFRHETFDSLGEQEIFELILKSNQLEEEFDTDFSYLPSQPTNELWAKHHVGLDESIDAFQIVVIEEKQKLKFIWKAWRQPSPLHEIGKLYSSTVEYASFLSTVDEFFEFLKKEYPDHFR